MSKPDASCFGSLAASSNRRTVTASREYSKASNSSTSDGDIGAEPTRQPLRADRVVMRVAVVDRRLCRVAVATQHVADVVQQSQFAVAETLTEALWFPGELSHGISGAAGDSVTYLADVPSHFRHVSVAFFHTEHRRDQPGGAEVQRPRLDGPSRTTLVRWCGPPSRPNRHPSRRRRHAHPPRSCGRSEPRR